MLFHSKKNAPVSCPISTIFEIIQDDLNMGICCNIDFTYKSTKHQIGVWGDDGETEKNIVFYLDKCDFSSFEDLKQSTLLDGIPLLSLTDPLSITECDGCYPRSIPLLEQYTDRLSDTGDEHSAKSLS